MYKKIGFLFVFLLMVFLITNPLIATNTVKETLALWYEKVLPALFPTLILVKMILSANLPIKHIKTFCALSGIVCGFPIGAISSMSYIQKGKLSKEEGLLCSATFNLFSPVFLVSYIADCMMESPVLVLLILYSVQLFVYICLKPFVCKKDLHFCTNPTQKNETFTTDVNYKVVDASILSSCEATMRICGYMVLCNLANIALYEITNLKWLQVILAPIMEMTGGASVLAKASLPRNIKNSILLGACSFGGMSGLFQVHHIVKEADVSFVKYTLVKVFSALITGTVAYLYYTISR